MSERPYIIIVKSFRNELAEEVSDEIKYNGYRPIGGPIRTETEDGFVDWSQALIHQDYIGDRNETD